jgi:outer membrane receptor protein involved in Fe transport
VGPGDLELHARYNHVDKYESSLSNTPGTQVQAVDYINASLTYRWDQYRLTVYGRNLTDEQVEVNSPIATLFQAALRTPGRSWGVEFQLDFGS